ncbi:MAG: hypothetical protein E6Q89_04225, partial [Bacteroidia bacterium]
MYKGDNHKVGQFVFSALVFVAIAGLLLGFLIIIFNRIIVTHLLNVTGSSFLNTSLSLYFVALCIPIFLVTNILNGYQEGMANFRSLAMQRIVVGSLYFLLPVIYVMYIPNLLGAVMGVVSARFIGFFYALLINLSIFPNRYYKLSKSAFKELLTFSSWITLSNIISPILVYIDRFIIAHVMGANIIALYSGPSDIINKIVVFPSAIAKAVFPILSSRGNRQNVLKQYKFS